MVAGDGEIAGQGADGDDLAVRACSATSLAGLVAGGRRQHRAGAAEAGIQVPRQRRCEARAEDGQTAANCEDESEPPAECDPHLGS